MNYYQRRIACLSAQHIQTAIQLNKLDSPTLKEVEPLFDAPKFFVQKKKKRFEKELTERVMECYEVDERGTEQIILVSGEDILKKDLGLT